MTQKTLGRKARILSAWDVPILISLYLACWFAQTRGSVDLRSIPGIFLLLYFPGRYLTKLIPRLDLNLGKFGRIALSVLYSFAFASVACYIVQSRFGFNTINQIWLIIATNLILYLLAHLFPKLSFVSRASVISHDHESPDYIIRRADVAIILIAFALTAVPIILSPLVQNADNFFTLIQKSITFDQNLLGSRQLFASFTALSSKFLGLSLTFVFRNIYVWLYFASTLFLLDYLKLKIKNQSLVAIGYLALFISPVILTEINIIRPQVAMLVFTLPVLILSMISIQRKDILPAIIATGFALVSLKYHELSAAILLISLISILFSLGRLTFIEKKISWKHWIVSALLIYSYWKLLGLDNFFKNATSVFGSAFAGWNHLTWRWWFLSNYRSVDGIDLSWSGIEALKYYLYNGLLLLIFIVVLYFFIARFRHKLSRGSIIPITYFTIFLFFAEVMPRLGLYFLPNRSWVHLMLGATIIFVLQLEQVSKLKISYKYLIISALITIAIGLAGTVYVAKNNIYNVFPEEMRAAKFIKNSLPYDAVVLSSQSNESLFSIYALRSYGQIDTGGNIIDSAGFDNLVTKELEQLSKEKVYTIEPKILQVTYVISEGGKVQENQSVVQQGRNIVNGPVYNGNNPVYFFYSYRKLSGVNGSRVYQKDYIDENNRQTYQNLGLPIAYQDDSSILIKVR